jgi:hypothetical protein
MTPGLKASDGEGGNEKSAAALTLRFKKSLRFIAKIFNNL